MALIAVTVDYRKNPIHLLAYASENDNVAMFRRSVFTVAEADETEKFFLALGSARVTRSDRNTLRRATAVILRSFFPELFALLGNIIMGKHKDVFWTDERLMELKTLRYNGMSQSRLAAHFNKTPSAISGIISRNREMLGDPAVDPREGYLTWNAELLARAKELWDDGWKDVDIADKIGCQPKAWRRQRTLRPEIFVPRNPGTKTKKKKNSEYPFYQELLRKAREKTAERRALGIPPDRARSERMKETNVVAFEKKANYGDGSAYRLENVEPVAFSKLKGNHCKFMLSNSQELNGSETLCCGSAVSRGVYCDAHASLVYIGTTYRR